MKIVVISIILLGMNYCGLVMSAEGQEVTTVDHTPKSPSKDDNFTVTATVVDSVNITQFRLIYCTLTPEYFCHVPSYKLVENNEGEFTTSFKILEENSQTFGYQFVITYNDDIELKLPKELGVNYGLNVVEPVEGVYYYQVLMSGFVQSTPTSEASFQIGYLSLIFLMTVRKINKRNIPGK
jgi:hypothetical protein